MNHLIKIFLLLSASFAFFSCSDEFVHDQLDISGVAASAIILSPDWEPDDYQFKCREVGNADFTILSKPDWLTLDSNAGKITDSIATIHGAAIAQPRFSETGFYVDQMIVKANGKKIAVPVYYITEGNPAVEISRTLHLSSGDAGEELLLSNTGNGILLWDIVSMPSWLSVNKNQFNPEKLILGKGAMVLIPLIFNVSDIRQNKLEGTIVLKTNDKNNPMVEIAVTVNLGDPNLNLYNLDMNFGISATSKKCQIDNNGSGILFWKLEGLPDWLSVSAASGIVMPFSQPGEVTFTCLRANVPPGLHTATFYLKSNDPGEPSVAITATVRVAGINPNIKALEGNITDAAFDKTTNTLYYVTSQPNQLVAYDVSARTVLHQVALSNAPTCLAMTDDFKKALVGHGGSISNVDLSTLQVTNTYQLDATVHDIEWAYGDWCCFTYEKSTRYSLYWLNVSTGETYQTPHTPMDYSLSAGNLKKIPGQLYIVASSTGSFPSGIFVFDIRSKGLRSYCHTNMSKAWFFNQDQLMATGVSSIMRTSAVIATRGTQVDGPSTIGVLKVNQQIYDAEWLDFSEVSHSIWALFRITPNTWSPPAKATIYQFEDNDYSLVKSYSFDDLYLPDTQSAPYEVEAHYVFANNAATELSVLRKGIDNNSWSIEFMPVQN